MKVFRDDNGHDEVVRWDYDTLAVILLVFFYGEMGGIEKEVAWRSCDEISVLGWDVKGGYEFD